VPWTSWVHDEANPFTINEIFPSPPVRHKHDTTKYSVDSPFHVVCAVNVIFFYFYCFKGFRQRMQIAVFVFMSDGRFTKARENWQQMTVLIFVVLYSTLSVDI